MTNGAKAMFAASEHERRREAATADPTSDVFTEQVLEIVDGLWYTESNHLWRAGNEVSDRECALIREITRRSSLAFVVEAMDRDAEPDEKVVASEQRLLMLVAAGGYPWRQGEREILHYDVPLAQAEFAIEFMNDYPNASDNEPFEQIARAVMWTVESQTTLALPPESGLEHGDASLDIGHESMVAWCCDQEGLDRGALTTDEDGVRQAFTTGIALREVEGFFPSA